jgi:hypothetical protein
MSRRTVTLRRTSNRDGVRCLTAFIAADGPLCIEGQDWGPGVTAHFGAGITEYEWTWTIRRADIARLLSALGESIDQDPLTALVRHFSGERAGDLKRFLDAHQIRHESWSRLGD